MIATLRYAWSKSWEPMRDGDPENNRIWLCRVLVALATTVLAGWALVLGFAAAIIFNI